MPSTGTQAWVEAEAGPDPSVVSYWTLEFQHPAFLEAGDPVPIRIVAEVPDDMEFGIELGATFNAGETATFKAVPFRSELGEVAQGRMPECNITIDNASRFMIPHLQAAVQQRADIVLLLRQYLSSDLSEPAYGPVQYSVTSVMVDGPTVTGVARLSDLANKKFPSLVYTANEFPGLSA